MMNIKDYKTSLNFKIKSLKIILEALKRIFENPQPEVISLLEHMCCRNAKLKDLIDSVDYHKRGRNEIFGLSSSNSVRSLNSFNVSLAIKGFSLFLKGR